MKIALILFTRNELKNSQYMYPKIPFKLFDSTYVIDGNSTDGTREFWTGKKIKVFEQKYKGVGGAYESAFRNTREDALIFFHPDGNMDIRDLGEFIKRLKRGEGFIVATRMIKSARNEDDDNFLKPRKWFCQFLGIMANVFWGKKGNKTTDVTQGYRAIERSTYKKMKIQNPNPKAPDYEQVIRALKNEIKIFEFPTKEASRKYGETSMGSFRTGLAHIRLFLTELS